MRLVRRCVQSPHRYGRRFEDGEHRAVVLGARQDTSDAGNEMLVLVLGFSGPEGGVKVDFYQVTHLDRQVDDLIACLAPEHLDSWRRDGECDLDPTTLVGRECLVWIEGEQWRGERRPRVRRMLPF